MEANVENVARFNQLIRKSRTTYGTKSEAAFGESAIHRCSPPALVTELNRVNDFWIELRDDTIQARGSISVARRELE